MSYRRIGAPQSSNKMTFAVAGFAVATFCVAMTATGYSPLGAPVARVGSIARNPAFSMAGRNPSMAVRGEMMGGGAPLDPALIPGNLPYNAKKEGFTNAIERAIRNRDMPAVRLLEQARSEVIEKTANGGSMGKWDEMRAAAALKRRQGLMDLSISRREKEDELVNKLKAEGEFSLEIRDKWGLTVDIQKIINQQADTLKRALDDPADGARLISIKTQIDPMPWWENLAEHTMAMRVAQTLKEKCNLGKIAVLLEDPSSLSTEDTEGLVIGKLGDASVDLDGADVIFCIKPEVDNLERVQRLFDSSKKGKGDLIVLNGNYGQPSDPIAKKVRQTCKGEFSGGLQAISFLMDPVKLVPNVGGEPYPLPQWLVEAGYKATGNVAVTGNSGTGKSSLNNALRGLKPKDGNAAAVGVKETTIDPHGYDFEPAGDDMRLWDLPGAGTPKFPLESYMRNMGIKYFDEVIIASAARFTETDLELMDELRSHGIPFIALRTKVDLEIRNAEVDTGAGPEETLKRIRDDIQSNSLLPEERIYMVSSRKPDEFDFQRLKQYIVDSLHRGVEVKLAKALNRKLEVHEIWNGVI
eukprot:CAMPEP_0197518870 /NCGR_PEP_ID=MMETSP1318-20131121/4120_1 /TAXON_ID=552666 /ORGANISM="Partenskyella glossopodia, Strain RCC365" /LENGTH=581 /DNA_ID=CAMNT_0043069533 /DNA_START=39 /DNA_END=1784 /DNA_ORIENTATION=+